MKSTTRRGPVKTSTPKPCAPPTYAAALETFAYHMGEIMTCRPGLTRSDLTEITTGFGLGYGDGCPKAHMTFTIKAATEGADPWGPWATAFVDGVCIGNRCAARNALVAAYAPVIAWIAAHEAAATAKASPVESAA